MTAPITDYTSYDEVRAALGVTDEELEDSTLSLGLYADYLEAELEDVNVDLPATYETVFGVAVPSAEESRLLQSTRLFATFALAKQLTASLPLFAAKQVGDGKASVQRFDNPYRDTIAAVNRDYERMRNRLVQSLNALGTAADISTPRVFLSVVSPTSDPVTGS